VTGLTSPQDIVVDNANVYWTDASSIAFVSKQGGVASGLASEQSKPWRLALDESYVYWTNQLGAAVMRTLKDGTGTPELISTAIQPTGIAVVGDNVVWINQGDHTLRRAPKTGDSNGGTPILSDFYGSELAVHGTSIYAVDGSAYSFSPVIGVDTTTGTQTYVGNGNYLCTSSDYLFVDAGKSVTYVTWVDFETLQTVGNFSRHDGLSAIEIVADDCAFYSNWVTRIRMLPLSYRSELTVVTNVAARRIAVDADSLYWTDTTAIGKVTRP
jgi:hypothetical protein